MDVDKALILEIAVDGVGDQGTNPEYRLEGIGSGTQVGNGPQIFKGMALFLQGVVGSGGALHLNSGSLNLKGLLGLGSGHQGSGDNDGGAYI